MRKEKQKFFLQINNMFFISIIFLLSYLRINRLEHILLFMLFLNNFIVLIYWITGRLSILQKNIFIVCIIFILFQLIIYCAQLISSNNPDLITYIKYCMAVSNICALFTISWDLKVLRLFGLIITISGYLMTDDITFYTNSVAAIIVSICMILLIIVYLDKKLRLIWLSIIIFFIGKLFKLYSRTMIIAIGIVIVYRVITRIIWSNKQEKLLKAFAIVSIIIIPLHTLFYIKVYNNTEQFSSLLSLFEVVFSSKAFFTGREFIWDNIVRTLGNDIFIGLGKDIFETNFLYGMGHNLFISSLIHQGIIGTVAYFMFLVIIVSLIFQNYDKFRPVNKLSLYFLIVFFITQMNEAYFMDPYISMILYVPVSLAISLPYNNCFD